MYKFNGGIGAVICDGCRRMIDMDLSYEQFEGIYRRDGNLKKEDVCWKCKLEKDKENLRLNG